MLLTLCAIGILALALAVFVGGKAVWALDLVTFFWPVLALVALGVFALSLPFGGTILRLLSLGALGACALSFAMLPAAPGEGPGTGMRILTANVYIGNPDPRPFVALLTREQPDIVVTEETRRSFVEAVRGSGLYPFESEGTLAAADDKKIFSRYPIRQQRQLDDFPGRQVGRHALRVVVESPAGPIVVYAIHPDTPRSERQWRDRNIYFERLAEAVRKEAEGIPVVLAGDWNLPAHSPFFRRFFRETGYRFARPGPWIPVTRFATRLAGWVYFGSAIDHVAVSPEVRVSGWKRGADIGSNHLPVIVDLALDSREAVASR